MGKYILLIIVFNISISYAQKTVIIGTQTWTSENLDVIKFRNGDKIPQAKTAKEWETYGKVGEAAWCYGGFNKKGKEKCGKLYNWYAVNDPRGLAPVGFHIPDDSEWIQMFVYLGGMIYAGGKMKSQEDWRDNGNGTNSSGFSAYPLNGMVAPFWSSSKDEYSNEQKIAHAFELVNHNIEVDSKYFKRGEGSFVRCLKD